MPVAPEQRQIVPFDSKAHNRTNFSCGRPELDRYIREIASQDTKRDLARVFVVLDGADVVGFYSLSGDIVKKEDLPESHAKKLPNRPIPAVLLGRLAVDNTQQGRGLGARMMKNAQNRVLRASESIGFRMITVDAKDGMVEFYLKYGFVRFPDDFNRLFLPIATLRAS